MAGDCAALVATPREKAGGYAVRAGPPLAGNLRRQFADAQVDLLLREEDPFQAGKRRHAHARTGRSTSPYLKTRFSKSFW